MVKSPIGETALRSPRLLLEVMASSMLAVSAVLAQARGPIPEGRVTSGKLSFDGHATVGDFVGATTSLSGEVTGGPDISAVQGWVQAPVRTLKTGDGRRDKDLNKSMESTKYPDIRFELSRLTPKGGTPDSIAATLQGRLIMHGVSRELALPATVRFQGSEARVRSDFPVNLKDYRIGGLSKMLGVLKMYDNIEVHVDVVFGLEGSAPSRAPTSKQPRANS
jgi:polyisoprenoid-binding protein YceI